MFDLAYALFHRASTKIKIKIVLDLSLIIHGFIVAPLVSFIENLTPSPQGRKFWGGVYFCGLAVFCVLRELIFAIRKHCFFPLGINFFVSFKKNPAFIIFSILLNVFVIIIIIINFIIINTNEIPSELLRENLISSHEKITCYLHV